MAWSWLVLKLIMARNHAHQFKWNKQMHLRAMENKSSPSPSPDHVGREGKGSAGAWGSLCPLHITQNHGLAWCTNTVIFSPHPLGCHMKWIGLIVCLIPWFNLAGLPLHTLHQCRNACIPLDFMFCLSNYSLLSLFLALKFASLRDSNQGHGYEPEPLDWVGQLQNL